MRQERIKNADRRKAVGSQSRVALAPEGEDEASVLRYLPGIRKSPSVCAYLSALLPDDQGAPRRELERSACRPHGQAILGESIARRSEFSRIPSRRQIEI